MSPLRRRKKRAEATPARPDYLEGFLAQPADVGTSDVDIEAVEKADADRAAEHARIAQFVNTDEVFDRNAPRPSVRDTPL
jgi:hypothetical protein